MKKYVVVLWLAMTAAPAISQKLQRDTTITTLRIGYASGNNNTLTGAIDQITQDRMNKGLVISSLDALSGQTAGVQVTSGVNQEAMVSAVRVRGNTSLTGSNDPLVIIDGVAADLVSLSTIYPSDIENFTILKASETSQYGSRGAAGVIEVTTKKGTESKFHISYDGTVGFERIYKRVQMLNASQFRRAADARGLGYADGGADTDFGRSIERTGFVQNYHIAFGGGSETSNYRASLGMMEHKTVIRTNDYNRYVVKLDINQKAFDNHLIVDLGVFSSLQKFNNLPLRQKLLYSAQTFNPTFPDGANPDGSYNQVPEALWISNPNSLLKMKQDEDNVHFNVHLSAIVNLTRRLKLRAFGSYSYNTINNDHYYPTIVWSHGEAYRGNDKSEEWLGNLSLDYTANFRNSELNLLLLSEANLQKGKGFHTTVSGFSTNAFGYHNLKAGADIPWGGTDSYYAEASMESFMLRAQYSLMDRYTLTATARADASSKFGKNHRFGFFPSVSGAWVISNERWMQRLKFVNNAKLRIGYGLTGNLGGIGPYNSLEMLQPNGIVPLGGTTATTLSIMRNANPDLKWEVKRTFNVGLDVSLWNHRIAFSIDYYRTKSTDMLYVYDVPVPPFTYDKLLANLGSMQNRGLEIGFGITPIHTKDIDLSINTNWSFERNQLISLDGNYNGQHLTAPKVKGISSLWGAGFNGASTVVSQVVGEPIGVFLLPHCNGLVTMPDGSKHYDITKESYICGQATPKVYMGSNVALRIRQWDITMKFNGAFGHKIFNGTALTYMNMLSLPNYNVMAGAPEMNIQDQDISDYWLEPGDYVNIDYLTVGWTVPIRSKHISLMRFSLSVNNLATITGYSGLTPMINSSVINGSLGIDDKNTLPVYRSYSIGVSLKF